MANPFVGGRSFPAEAFDPDELPDEGGAPDVVGSVPAGLLGGRPELVVAIMVLIALGVLIAFQLGGFRAVVGVRAGTGA